MTKQIAIIDPFVKQPAINCFNNLVGHLKLNATYHMPSLMGLGTLHQEAEKTQGYIVLGSASHIHENLPWHAPLADFLLGELSKKKPVLGCCFGHQLVCHAYGAKVEYYQTSNDKQMGMRKVTIKKPFWNFEKDESFQLAVTHRQVVRDLPEVLESVGTGLENDIVIHKTLPFMGTQAHPEASDYFCHTDITNLKNDEIPLIQKDGTKLILRFFQHFNLLK